MIEPLELKICVLHDFTFENTSGDSVKIISPQTPVSARAFFVNDGVNVNVTINNLVFDGNNVGTGIESYTDNTLTINNTILRNHSVTTTSTTGNVPAGTALLARKGLIVIRNSEFTNNRAMGAANAVVNHGGAIYVDSTNAATRVRGLAIYTTKFVNNYTSGQGGAIYARGYFVTTLTKSYFENNEAYMGGVLSTNTNSTNSQGNITIDSCNFIGNNANSRGTQVTPLGGAFYVAYNVATSTNRSLAITNSRFSTNKVSATGTTSGGAIWLSSALAGGARSRLLNCTFDNNSVASGNGGALYLQGANSVKNSTFYANVAGSVDGGSGGAIYTITPDQNSSDSLIHCTFVRNQARTTGGALANSAGATTPFLGGVLAVENSLFSGSMSITSQLFNVSYSSQLNKIEENANQLPNYFATIDGSGNPILMPNGGYTPTLTTLMGGNARLLANYGSYSWRILKDQNNNTRPTASDPCAIVDAGSVNSGGFSPMSGEYLIGSDLVNDITAKTFKDFESAIRTLSASGNTAAVTFTFTKVGTYIMRDSVAITPCVTNAVVVRKQSGIGEVVIQPAMGKRVLIIRSNINVTIDSITFDGNNAGSGIESTTTQTLTITNSLIKNMTKPGFGGGVHALSGTLISRKNSFTNNTVTGSSSSGGAIYANLINAHVIDSCQFQQNTAAAAGAVSLGAGNSGTAKMQLSNSWFHKNTATVTNAGALYVNAAMSSANRSQIVNCTFDGNTAVTNGGAVVLVNYNTVKNSTFYTNSAGAAEIGGAIYTGNLVNNDSIVHCTFAGNTALNGRAVGGSATTAYFYGFGNLAVGNSTMPPFFGLSPSSSDNKTNTSTESYADYFRDIDGSNNPILQNNGGYTPTLMLKYGGSAHNKILNYPTKTWRLAKDQRDSIRPIDCGAEFGSVEIQRIDPYSYTFKPSPTACYNSLLDPDTLIASAVNIVDTIFYTDNTYTTEITTVPITLTNQTAIYVKFVTSSTCEIRDSLPVTISPRPLIKITSPQTTICSGTMIDLTAAVTNANPQAVVWTNYSSVGTISQSASGNESIIDFTSFPRTSDTTVYFYATVSGLGGCGTQTVADSLKITLKGISTLLITDLSSNLACVGKETTFKINTTNTTYIEFIGGDGIVQPGRVISDSPDTPDINEVSDTIEASYTPTSADRNGNITLAIKFGNEVCPFSYDTLKLFVLPAPTNIGFAIITQPQGLQTICVDTLYDVKVKAIDLGGLNNIKVSLFDDNNTKIQVSSAEYQYPYNSGTWQSLGNYVDSIRHYKYSLPMGLSSGDSLLVRFHVQAGCGFSSGDILKFTLDAKNHCDLPFPEQTLSSNVYTLRGDPVVGDQYTFKNTITPAVINSQSGDTLVCQMQLIIEGLQPTDSTREKIVTFIPDGLTYDPTSFVNNKNAGGSTSITPVAGGTEYAMVIPSGIVPKDTVIYSYKIAAKNAPCGSYTIRNQVYYSYSASCSGASCTASSVRASGEDSVFVERYALALADTVQSFTRLGLWGGHIQLKAINGFLAGDSLKADFYIDRDGNNYYSPADVLVATRVITSTTNIPKGGILHVDIDSIPVEPGRQLIAYSTDSLLCSTVQFPATVITGPDTVCQNVLVVFEAAEGMVNYSFDEIPGATRVPFPNSAIADYPKQNKAQFRFTSAVGEVAVEGRYSRVIGNDTIPSEKTIFYTQVLQAATYTGLSPKIDSVCSPSVVKFYADNVKNVTSRLWTASTVAGSLSGANTDTLTYSVYPRATDTTLWVHYTGFGYKGCNNILDSVRLTIFATLKQGIPASPTLCSGSTYNFNFAAATGGHKNTYQWQDSVKAGSWTNIPGATHTTYTTTGLIDTTWYRRIVIAGCGLRDTSVSAMVAILPVFATGSIAAEGQTICAGSPLLVINSSTLASGGDGKVRYRWMINGSEIPGTNSSSYSPAAISTEGVYTFTREARDSACTVDFQVSLGAWVVVIHEPFHRDYIVNANGTGDFISLKEAADRYNTCGISANSRLIIKSDLNELETIEFLGAVPGSESFSLTIISDGVKRAIKFKRNQ